MLKKTRAQARLDGDEFYYTDKECIRGMKAQRKTATARCQCIKCKMVNSEACKKFRGDNPGYMHDYYAKDKGLIL